MKWTRWLLLLIGLLGLTSAGCARRDWVSDLLVLTDVWGMANDPLFSKLNCQSCFLRFRRVGSPVPAASEPAR